MTDYDIIEIMKELEFWEKNKFDIYFNRKIPNEVPNGVSKEILMLFQKERDFYSVTQRIAYLKSICTSENQIKKTK